MAPPYDPSAEARVARLAALEVEVRELKSKVNSGLEKLDLIHDLLMQAKGAKWAIVGMATLGGALAGSIHKWLPFLSR